jgi:hypothetical protein
LSNAKLSYQQAMERLYLACIVLSGTALVVDHAHHSARRVHALRMHKPLHGRSRPRSS